MATETTDPAAEHRDQRGPSPFGRGLYAGFGVIATLVGLGAGHFIASLLRPDSSPLLAVGSTIIDLTPTPLKEWAIRTFESDGFSILFIDFPAMNYDKVILVGSVFLGVLVFAAIVGAFARDRLLYGLIGITGLVLVAAAAVVTRPQVGFTDIVPIVATLAAGLGALWGLDRVARSAPEQKPAVHPEQIAAANGSEEATDEPAEVGSSPSRRGVLIAMGVLTAAAAAFGSLGRVISNYRGRPEDVALPDPTNSLQPVPEGLEQRFDKITPMQISNADFYRVDTRLDTPVVSSDGWSLTVDGDVENELEISFDELLDMPMVERDITLTCVSNSVGGIYVGGARWLGVPLNDILDMAGVGSDADQILSTDFDGMTISTPLDVATDGRDSLIAVGMNGEALPREHGFPVRMVVPGLYGFISATKWLTKLTLTTYADQESYWTEKNWATDAPIKPSARIDTPRPLEKVPAGDNRTIGGVAWAQNDDGVSKVQVQIDGGPWRDAELGPDLGNVYWRQWYFPWNASPGSHTIKARVTAGDGDVQTDVRAKPFPEGSSGIHTVNMMVE